VPSGYPDNVNSDSDRRPLQVERRLRGHKKSLRLLTNFKDNLNLSFLTCACCLKICLSYATGSDSDVYWEVPSPQIELVRSHKNILLVVMASAKNWVEHLLANPPNRRMLIMMHSIVSEFGLGLLKGLKYLCKPERCPSRGGLTGLCPGNSESEPADVASMFGDVISNTSTRRNNRVSVTRMGVT
jgi:hypothetical protein